MRIYLVQHGEAVAETEDPERPLSAAGATAVQRMAEWAREQGLGARVVLHSGKLRAAQTAQAFASELEAPEGLREVEGLKPKDPPREIAGRLADLGDGVMLVGHLPHLSRLAGLLLTGDPDREPVAFRNAGIVCLERPEDDAKWVLAWSMVPELCV